MNIKLLTLEVAKSPYCGCLYYASNALARVMTRLAEEAFAPTGLSPSHAYVLLAIIKQPEIASGDLAGVMQLTPSTITRLVEKCFSKGLISKRSEGRFVFLSPTPSGKSMEPQLLKALQNLNKAIEQQLGESQSRTLTKSIAHAADLLEREAD